MANVVATSFVKILPDTSKVGSGISSSVSKAGKVAGGVLKAGLLAGGTMAAAGIATAIKGITGFAQFADDMNTLSKQTGISTDALQKYKNLSELTDVSMESMAKASKKVAMNLATDAGAKKFEDMGIAIRDANGNLLSQDEILQKSITKIQGMKNDSDKASASMALFGKAGSDLLPVMKMSSEEMAKTTDEVNKFTAVFGSETLAKANAFNDKLDLIKQGIGGLPNIIGAIAMGDDDAVSQLNKIISNIGTEIQNVGGTLVNGIIKVLPSLINALLGVVDPLLNGLLNALPQFLNSMINIIVTILPKLMNTFATAIPNLINSIANMLPKLFPALVGMVTKLVDSIIGMLPTLIPAVINLGFQLIVGIINSLPKLLTSLVLLISKVIVAIIKSIPKIITGVVKAIPDIIVALIKAIPQIITAIVKELPTIIIELVKAIPEVIVALAKAGPEIVVALGKAIPSIMGAFKNLGKTIFSSFKNALSGIGSFFSGLGKTIFSSFKNALSGIGSFFSGLGEKIWDGLKGMLGGIGDFFKGPINKIIGVINKIPGVDIPYLARGGIATAPTMAVVGEAGPEAIIPLSKIGTLLQGQALGSSAFPEEITLVDTNGSILARTKVIIDDKINIATIKGAFA